MIQVRGRERDVFHHKIERFTLLWHIKNIDDDGYDDNHEDCQNYDNIDHNTSEMKYHVEGCHAKIKCVFKKFKCVYRKTKG